MGRVYYNALGHKANVIEDGIPYDKTRRTTLFRTIRTRRTPKEEASNSRFQ